MPNHHHQWQYWVVLEGDYWVEKRVGNGFETRKIDEYINQLMRRNINALLANICFAVHCTKMRSISIRTVQRLPCAVPFDVSDSIPNSSNPAISSWRSPGLSFLIFACKSYRTYRVGYNKIEVFIHSFSWSNIIIGCLVLLFYFTCTG